MYRAALGPTSLKPFRLPRTILFLLLVAGRKPRPVPKSAAFPHKDDKLPFCLANLPSLWLFVPLHLLPSVFTGLQLFETLFSLAPCTQLRVHFSLTFSSLLGYGLYMPSFSTPHPFLMKTLVDLWNTYNKAKLWYTSHLKWPFHFQCIRFLRGGDVFSNIWTKFAILLQKMTESVEKNIKKYRRLDEIMAKPK